MVKATQQLIDTITIPFGKYKDKPLKYVYENDIKYFKWLESISLTNGFNDTIQLFNSLLKVEESNLVDKLIAKVNDFIANGEQIHRFYLDGVGIEYSVANIYTSEVNGNKFSICGKRALDNKNFFKLHNYLKEKYKEMRGNNEFD